MKDIIKRTLISIVVAAFLWYIVLLALQWVTIVQWEYINSNMLMYGILIIVSLFLIIFFGIYPVVIKFSKPILFVVWVWLIIIGHYVLLNDPHTQVYLWDIVKIFWVIVSILAWTNVLVSKKVKEKKQKSKMTIIEA